VSDTLNQPLVRSLETPSGAEQLVHPVDEPHALSPRRWTRALRSYLSSELNELRETAPHMFERAEELLAQHPTKEELNVERSVAMVTADLEHLMTYELLEVKPFQAEVSELLDQLGAYLSPRVSQEYRDFFAKKTTRIQTRADRKRELVERLKQRINKSRSLSQAQASEATRSETLRELYQLLRQWREVMRLLKALSLGAPSGAGGSGYDLTQGLLHERDFELLQEFARLAESEGIKALLEELGRLKDSERELEELFIEGVELREERRLVSYLTEEVIGVTLGGELQRALASELGLLEVERGELSPQEREGDELLELLLYSRVLERSITQYELAGVEVDVVSEEVSRTEEREVPLKSGPFVICVDTSGSMSGQPERVAKTLAFVLLRAALQEGRACFLINFSTRIETLDLTEMTRSLPSLLSFLKRSFHGGTDVAPALEEALRQLQRESFERADVLVVSDFVMPSLPAGLLSDIQAQKTLGTRFHSAVISAGSSASALPIFDTEWSFKQGWSSLIQGTLIQSIRR